MDEFSLIDKFFKPLDLKRDDVLLGIGDDAACLHVPEGMNLLVSTDTLVEKVHFLPEWQAYDIAYRSVMVSVSDLAAMAALPCWATLALTLPQMDPAWLASFARGLKDSLKQFNIALIGGDTTRGPLSITLTVFGQAPFSQEVRRSGAKPGDIILVSGNLGAAALAVKFLDAQDIPPSDRAKLMHKLLHPQPRIDLIKFLRLYATAAIDISDGLGADLNHICTASGTGACLNLDAIPIDPLVKYYYRDKSVDLALTGGDDYELCFTVPELKFDSLLSTLKQAEMVCYPIGVIEKEPGLRVKTAENLYHELVPQGYSHF
ncbi:thiamine-phosphate kinase [Legionella rowbothamii]|uniref:thiamine-phosphate kinase n=1 Tax=Legionella rowbothamii TaxID=96229 RepID=UPI00105463C0|nr:thiamine-phosphate kinase [Legionella rowbothamii]